MNPKLISFPILLLASLLSFSCQQDFDRETALDYTTAKVLWESHKLTNYSINQKYGCRCFVGGGITYTLSIQDGQIKEVRPNAQDSSIVPKEIFQTVDELFLYIKEEENRKPYKMDVKYHPRYGYPTYISVDLSNQVADEEMMIENSDLKF